MAKRQYERVGTVDVYRQKPKPKIDFGEVLGALILLGFGALALSHCAG